MRMHSLRSEGQALTKNIRITGSLQPSAYEKRTTKQNLGGKAFSAAIQAPEPDCDYCCYRAAEMNFFSNILLFLFSIHTQILLH